MEPFAKRGGMLRKLPRLALLRIFNPSQLLPVDAGRVENEARRIEQCGRFGCEFEQCFRRALGDLPRSRCQAGLAISGYPRAVLEHVQEGLRTLRLGFVSVSKPGIS